MAAPGTRIGGFMCSAVYSLRMISLYMFVIHSSTYVIRASVL